MSPGRGSLGELRDKSYFDPKTLNDYSLKSFIRTCGRLLDIVHAKLQASEREEAYINLRKLIQIVKEIPNHHEFKQAQSRKTVDWFNFYDLREKVAKQIPVFEQLEEELQDQEKEINSEETVTNSVVEGYMNRTGPSTPITPTSPPPPNVKPNALRTSNRISGGLADRINSLEQAGLDLSKASARRPLPHPPNIMTTPSHVSNNSISGLPQSPFPTGPSSMGPREFNAHPPPHYHHSPKPSVSSPLVGSQQSGATSNKTGNSNHSQHYLPSPKRSPVPFTSKQDDLPRVVTNFDEEIPRSGSAPPTTTPRTSRFMEQELMNATAEHHLNSLPSPPISPLSNGAKELEFYDTSIAKFAEYYPPVDPISSPSSTLFDTLPSIPSIDPATGLTPPPRPFLIQQQQSSLPPPPQYLNYRDLQVPSEEEEDVFPNFNPNGSNVVLPPSASTYIPPQPLISQYTPSGSQAPHNFGNQSQSNGMSSSQALRTHRELPTPGIGAQSLPELPIQNTILPEVLWQYLAVALTGREGVRKILIIDVRRREEFERGRIKGDTVCIDPFVLRKITSSEQLENSLSISPPAEARFFEKRHTYDYVVIVDQNSSDLPHGPEETDDCRRALWNLTQIIWQKEMSKHLRKPPMLLVGGWEGWVKKIGDQGVERDTLSETSSDNLSTTRGSDDLKKERRKFIFNGKDTKFSSKEPARNVVEVLASRPPNVPYGTTDVIRPNPNGITFQHSSPVTIPALAAYRSNSQDYDFVPSLPSQVRPAYQQQMPLNGTPPVRMPRRMTGDVQPSIEYTHSPPLTRPSFEYPLIQRHNVPAPLGAPQPPPLAAPPNGHVLRSPAPLHATRPRPTQISNGSRFSGGDWNATVGFTGLRNLGNTCYMNSTIQCLSATVPFATYFKEGAWKSHVNRFSTLGTKGQLSDAFATLLRAMWGEQFGNVSPISFRQRVGLVAKHFMGAEQQDGQEFLTVLLDALHEDLNLIQRKPPALEMTPEREKALEELPTQVAAEKEWQLEQQRNHSVVSAYFQGQFRNRLQCMTCRTTSTTYNVFNTLSLPVPNNKGSIQVTLTQCLDLFVKEEIMENGDAWHCPHCKAQRKATKQLTLSKLPEVLVIHLKRFSFKGPFSDKLETPVHYPLEDLDMTSYLPSPPSIDQCKAWNLPLECARPLSLHYDLYGVVNHFGSLSSGHYTAFVKSRSDWFYADDSKISPCDAEKVQARSAYMLFYRRRPS